MSLSNYDILGVSKNASFRLIKNAYHDLARIYHPDSTLILIPKLSIEEKNIAFNTIQNAYSNIKQKLNITEIDLPKYDLEYENFDIKQNDKINNLESFNKEFDKLHSEQSKDEPYSIHYQEPENKLDDTKITLKQREYHTNDYEFGINYVSDYSGEYYSDINSTSENSTSENITFQNSTSKNITFQNSTSKNITFQNSTSKNSTSKNITFQNSKEKIDPELETKLEHLIETRKHNIELKESEKMFIFNQNKYKLEIENQKKKIEIKRMNNLRLT